MRQNKVVQYKLVALFTVREFPVLTAVFSKASFIFRADGYFQ